MEKSCVLFDLGGVIVNWHNLWFTQEVSEQFQLKHEEVKQEFEKNLKDISTGVIAEKEFLAYHWKRVTIARSNEHSRITTR